MFLIMQKNLLKNGVNGLKIENFRDMLFSYNWLQSYFKKKFPKPKELAEVLTMHAFEIEGIEKKGKDWILDIDVLPNRPDCFSHIGIARECGALLNSKFKTQSTNQSLRSLSLLRNESKPQLKTQNLKSQDFIGIEVKDKNVCPRYTARVITDVKVGESLKWMQERLRVCGLKSINNIVDAVNYVMLEMGQPLHAFDFDKIKGKTIIVRKARKGEKIITLDEEKYDLDENVLVIADKKSVLAIAGIKGGKKAEINESTKTIVLEAGIFESQTIRRGSRLLNLKTDASYRFEHGLDPNLTEEAINRAAALIQKISKAKVARELIDFYPQKIGPKKIKLDLDYVEKLLGAKISQKEIERILKNLGFKFQVLSFKFQVEVPSFRLDISIPEDLIEEIGRVYGYEKIKPILPIAALIPSKRNDKIFWEDRVKNILKEAGFTEVYNYSFVSPKQVSSFNLRISDLVEVKNPVSVEQKYLRPSLILNLLKNVQINQKHFQEIKIFELGKIYKSRGQILESEVLSGGISQKKGAEGFYELKGAVDMLLNKLGISDIRYNEYPPAMKKSRLNILNIWQPGRCAEIKINGEEVGFLGEISPNILKILKIKGAVVAFALDFEKLAKQCSEEQIYQPVSSYPSAVRDIAVLTPKKVKVAEVLNKINSAGGKLVTDVDLFDIYQGEELPWGKKNLAFHIIYQARDRTLTSQEIDAIHQKIVKALEKEPAWQVRK